MIIFAGSSAYITMADSALLVTEVDNFSTTAWPNNLSTDCTGESGVGCSPILEEEDEGIFLAIPRTIFYAIVMIIMCGGKVW